MAATKDDHKVALVTGTNGYLGISIVERLIAEVPEETRLTVVLTSRTFPGITEASEKIRKYVDTHPRKGLVELDYVVFDQLDMVSVYGACYQLKKRFKKIDYLFFNSSFSKGYGIDYWQATKWFFKDPIYAFTAAPFKIQEPSGVSYDGIGRSYQANVFSPWFTVNQLIPLLKDGGRVIWISSAISSPEQFSADDIELRLSEKAYEASKYEIELLHVASYRRLLKDHGIQSWLVQPGIFKSTTFTPTLNIFTYVMMMVMFYACRWSGSPYHCIYPEIAANCPVWLALKADPEENDQITKYGSSTTKSGEEVIMESELPYKEKDVDLVYEYTEALRKEWEKKLEGQVMERLHD